MISFFPFYQYLRFRLRSLLSKLPVAHMEWHNYARKKHQDEEIEAIRTELRRSHAVITIQDKGAGPKVNPGTARPISSIAKYATSTQDVSLVLQSLVEVFEMKHVVELGTSLGINACYLGRAYNDPQIITIEGDKTLSAYARRNFNTLGFGNIQLISGDIDQVVPKSLQEQIAAIDLLYMDANHTYEATLRYFNLCRHMLHDQSIVVVGDIYWSEEMKRAWEHLTNEFSGCSIVDAYFIGIIFFDTHLPQGYFYTSL